MTDTIPKAEHARIVAQIAGERDTAFARGIAKGRAEERAKVVAWLRAPTDRFDTPTRYIVALYVERGEHDPGRAHEQTT